MYYFMLLEKQINLFFTFFFYFKMQSYFLSKFQYNEKVKKNIMNWFNSIQFFTKPNFESYNMINWI